MAAFPPIVQSVPSVPARNVSLLRRIWYVFGAGCGTGIGILTGIWVCLHRSDPQLINYAVACIPVVLTILIAFVPDLRRAHVAWRMGIVGIGVIWSILLWRQQILTQHDQELAVDTAVDRSNKHSDKQIDGVRQDLRDVGKHSDQQIASVKDGLKELTGLVSKTASELGESIGKVKPSEPQFAKLQFSLYDPSASEPVVVASMRADPEGVFSVDFVARNSSDTSTKMGDLWIQLCEVCTYAKEPEGFDKPKGINESSRHQVFSMLNPGVTLEKMNVQIKITKPVPWFELGFRYSCETCGKISDTQKARIFVLSQPRTSARMN